MQSMESNNMATIIFTPTVKARGIIDALQIVDRAGLDLAHVETRAFADGLFECLIEIANCHTAAFASAVEKLKASCNDLRVVGCGQVPQEVPATAWFPRCLKDLDFFASDVLQFESDYIGLTNSAYSERRKLFEEIASNYRQ